MKLGLAAAALVSLIVWQEPAWRAEGSAAFDDVWKTVAETFYDPSFGGLDWEAVRREIEPRVAAAASPDEIRRAITTMLARLKRSHFVLLSASEASDEGPLGPASVPIDIRVLDEGLLITRVHSASAVTSARLRAGDVVLAIDDVSTTEWRSSGSSPDDRQKNLRTWRRAQRALSGASGSRAVLSVRSPGGIERSVGITREIDAGEPVTVGNLPPMRVRTDVRELRTPGHRRAGLIAFNVWMTAIDTHVAAGVDRFRAADGLIIDLRGNPGGLATMMSGIAGHLFDSADPLIGRMQTRQATLEFHPNPRVVTAGGKRVTPFAGPVAILVDGLTGSTSECFSGGLQALGRARVFGGVTMGQALPALTKQLPNGDVFMYAIGNFVTANGGSVEGGGVVPDEPVAVTPATLAGGRDPVLDAALSWLDRQVLAPKGPLLVSSDDLQAR